LEKFGNNLEAKEIAQRAKAEDTAATKCIEIYAEQLACSLSTIINMVDPHAIVLGGGLSNIESLYDLLPNYLTGHIFNDTVKTKILRPAFGDASGAIGAACLWTEN
jgi:fructokinase